jgi:hypothetical protein
MSNVWRQIGKEAFPEVEFTSQIDLYKHAARLIAAASLSVTVEHSISYGQSSHDVAAEIGSVVFDHSEDVIERAANETGYMYAVEDYENSSNAKLFQLLQGVQEVQTSLVTE